MSIPLITILLFLNAPHGSITGVRLSRWIDPCGRGPTDYQTWRKGITDLGRPTRIGRVYEKHAKGRQDLVDVIVNNSVYPAIATEIEIFIDDLIDAGYNVQVDTISGMSEVALRSHLAGIADLVGAILVGEVPVAWFETNGFGAWEEFPHDLYFSDLDGNYIDADGDSIYDNHTGNVEPEIWVGRIYSRNLTWNSEISLLKNYFYKNHEYRTSGSSLPQRALCYIDDDWSGWTTCGLEAVYSTVVVENNDYQTTASNYRTRLGEGYEWLHLCSHSSPWGHTFKYPYDEYRGTVFNYEIFSLGPHAHFYNLFACSGTRFTEENYSAGWYLFGDNYGLCVIGSAKTGGMLSFSSFYSPLGTGLSIGEAFKTWFTLYGESDWDWFYGLNILGDPTLKPKGRTTNCEYTRSPAGQTINSWNPPEIIAPDPESDGFPRIIADQNGSIWVVWESGRSTIDGRAEIYSAYYDQGGWSNALAVGPHIYWDFGPDLGIDSLDRPVAVWAGWQDIAGNYQYDIFYSVYDGAWTGRQLITALDPGFDMKPALVRDRTGRLWIAWESRRDLDLNIYSSFFNGITWSPAVAVTDDPADETSPAFVIDSLGRPWIFYTRRQTSTVQIWAHYYNGAQWLESGPISGSQKNCYHPSAAVDGQGRIWVAWQSTDDEDCDIYANYYETSWSTPLAITTDPASDLFPDLAVDQGGNIWLVYQTKSAGVWDICCRYCNNLTWSDPEIVADLDGANINPRITCDGNNELWAVWQSSATGNWEIVAAHRPGYGIAEKGGDRPASNYPIGPTIFSQQLPIKTGKKNRLVIYDIKGSVIQTLLTDEEGWVTWSPQNIPSGYYFIVGGDQPRRVTKVVFLKR